MEGKIECPICHRFYKTLATHLKHKHNLTTQQFNEIYPGLPTSFKKDEDKTYKCVYCDFIGTVKQVKSHILDVHNVDGKIECPICHEYHKSLITHLFYFHDLTTMQFRDMYPLHPLQVGVFKEKQKCPYCDFMGSPAGLGTHIAYKHKDIKRGDPNNKLKHEKSKGFKCPICKKYKVNFSQHIEMTHGIKWDDFVKEFNWTLPMTCVTDDHKENLSKNKKIFYHDTERGIELRQEQSVLMSGKGNIIHLPGVRDKASRSASKRIIDADQSIFFRIGIKVKYKTHTYRSLEEFKIALLLIDNNVDFEYENEWVCYFKEDGSQHRYVVDFKIDGIIYEVKSDANKNQYEDEEKYIQCRKMFGSKFRIVTAKMLCDELGLENRKILIESFFKERCKDILKNEDVTFSKWSKSKNYSFFKKLDPEFEHNEKFICL